MGTLLMVGTRKGLWVGRSEDRESWSFDGPFFDMQEVYSVMVDTRGDHPRLLAGASSSWLGTTVSTSDDLGATWHHADDGGIRFPDDTATSLARVWQLTPGTGPDVVYAGTEPGAVFRSDDGGHTFTLERALWDHPHRPSWQAGFGGQAFHTILPHPTDPASVTAALSTGGVYQTQDGGASWEPRNVGIRAEFLPEGMQYPEFGQCVHKIARNAAKPERLYLQNHGGVYRSDDEAASWTSIAEGLPADFGFPVVVHPTDPDTVYLFPIAAGEGRYPPGGKAAVYRSRDAGESWQRLDEGFPDGFYVAVLRDAMTAEAPADGGPTGLHVGTRNGSVWSSYDEGDSWRQVVANLPDVVSVRAASI